VTPTEDDLRAAYRTPPDDAALNRLRASISELDRLEPAVQGRPRQLRRWLAPALAAAAVVTAFVGIAVVKAGHHPPVGNPGPAAVSTAQPDPSAALQLWAGFPVTASPRPLVLTGPAVIDPTSGFAGGPDKLAYASGSFDLRTELPAAPAAVDGQPIMSAAQAFAALRGSGSGSQQSAPALVISGVTLGTGTFSTDRGPRSLPAWIFRFAAVADPAAVLAIPTADRWPRPGMPTSNGNLTGVSISGDGTQVSLTFVGAAPGSGPCDAEYTADVSQSATALAISVRQQPKPSLPSSTDGPAMGCDLIGYQRTLTVTLQPPLGNRVLVDSQGAPIPAK
jgi:hypothetical protein